MEIKDLSVDSSPKDIVETMKGAINDAQTVVMDETAPFGTKETSMHKLKFCSSLLDYKIGELNVKATEKLHSATRFLVVITIILMIIAIVQVIVTLIK
jgi:hypothetical protein